MSAQMYIRLRQLGMTAVGACGLMGNIRAESAMRSNNAQDSYGRNDEQYTAAVDAGGLDADHSFVYDQVGYGYCQWTSSDRKARLLAYARSEGRSIGDGDMQLRYAVKELREFYPGTWQKLQQTNGVYEAAQIVCMEYERPANAADKVAERAGYANEFYMQFGGLAPPVVPDLGTTGDTSSGTADAAPPFPQGEGKIAESYWPPRVLAYGMYGGDVVALQGLLIAHGYPAGISGTFDEATASQLKNFQSARGLKVDAIAGPKSWAALTKGV